MSKISRTWWGECFIAALAGCTDTGRLQRGRRYAGPSRLLSFKIDNDTVRATIRGNVNPYFGVYKEPRYEVEIRLKRISAKAWKTIIQQLAGNAGWLSRLLMDEVPEDIEAALCPHAIPFTTSKRQ